MQNIMLLYNFESDEATLSGGSWSAELPASNMQNEKLYRLARTLTADMADTKISITLAAPTLPLAVGLIRTNISAAGSWRIRAFSDPERTLAIYDSGWTIAATRAPFGTIPYGTAGLYDGILPDAVDLERGRMLLKVLEGAAISRYWLIEIDDEDNPAGYVDIGRLVLSSGFQPSVNYAYGGALNFIDNSVSANTLSGGEIRWHRLAPRSMRFALEYLPHQELFGPNYDFMRGAGFDYQVFVISDPELTDNTLERRSYLGTLKAMDGMTQSIIKHGNSGFEIKEVIL